MKSGREGRLWYTEIARRQTDIFCSYERDNETGICSSVEPRIVPGLQGKRTYSKMSYCEERAVTTLKRG
jgi:hypothetical protein